MSKAGDKMLKALDEAVDIARGTIPAARITIKGHTYVPLAEYERLRAVLTIIADKDKTPIYHVNFATGESKQVGWGHGTVGGIAIAALDNQQSTQEEK